MSLGILVLGGNHLILGGPEPAPECARRLASRFAMELANIAPAPATGVHGPWSIRTREFRERLEWAIALRSPDAIQPAVRQLLDELAQRGIAVRRETIDTWEGTPCD